ncbi:MAG: cytochrome c oxidase subunit 3 [Ginsengibacter sp.]
MDMVMNDQRKRIHPHKFTLWVAIGSIVMMFAGLTSAYIVKRNQANWTSYNLPVMFWYSTATILMSSFTMWKAETFYKQKEMPRYRNWLLITTALGLFFIIFQTLGFSQLWKDGITLTRSVSYSFLYVIVGLHAVHVLGGIIALFIIFGKAYSKTQKIYSSVPVEMMSTYWHFVDILWIYLLVFLIMIR